MLEDKGSRCCLSGLWKGEPLQTREIRRFVGLGCEWGRNRPTFLIEKETNKKRMEASVINAFRDKVNEYDIILHIYHNYNGKNKWNVICSAMDWIQVGVSGIDISTLERTNTDQASVKVITFLSCIDVMWEGIQQLHRVFFDTIDIPFTDDKSIFNKDIDDNRYWKEIRAAFAAHPTNLDGTVKGEKRFASWSGGGFGKSGDFSVIVYSNDPNKDHELFDISFAEIIDFATKRYNYLNTLMKRADEITDQWCEKLRTTPIILYGEELADITMLLKENGKRLDNDYIEYRLEVIKTVFEVETHGEKNTKAVNRYRDVLKKEIQLIYQILQNMDLNYEYESSADDSGDLTYSYENQHIFEPRKGMLGWAVDRLKKPLGKYVDLDSWESIEELQVLVRAGWWMYNQAI